MYKKENDIPIANYFEYHDVSQHGYNLRARDVIPALAVGHNSI